MNTANADAYIHADGHVLAAIDGSSYTESVCRHAAWAAERLVAPLQFVHVIERARETAPVDLSGSLALGEQETLLLELSALDERRSALAQQRGRLLLEDARRLAGQAGARADAIDTRLRHGGLVDTLSELEGDVRLFVLGKRGEQATEPEPTGVEQAQQNERVEQNEAAKEPLGTEVERVVRTVHRPLLVAPREFQPIDRVLVAFDGSATTRKGVQMIAASPLFRGLEVHVVTAAAASERVTQDLQWAGQTLTVAGFEAHTAHADGDAETVIGRYAREQRIDLLVMGAYGHSRIRELIVGSTTTAMLRRCRLPVLLLR